jgi:uncharacterized protein
MAGSSAEFHEAPETLSADTRERHRALVSLMEELEAVDWYDQRIDATADAELAAVLAHNRDEEKEHASMTLEWLRRHDAAWDLHLRRYLFTDTPVAELAEAAELGGVTPAPPATLGIGSLGDKEGL